VESIRIYHYGYLNKTVQAKDKRNRNMSIIQKELDKDPDNFFMLFNMGTEYYAMSNFTEALYYYKKSYEHFEPQLITGAKLILRMVSCYEFLGKTSEEFELIDEGLKYYPNFTDLEFKRAYDLYNKKKYYLALDSLYKCLKMGEPPSSLNDLIGVGTFRPYYILANIFFEMGDYDEALNCCDKTLSINPKFTEALSKMSQIMIVKELPLTEMKSKLESYFGSNFDEGSYFMLADIFYSQNKFDITKEYVEKADKISKDKNKINYYKGVCLFFQKFFNEAYNCFIDVTNGEFYERSIDYCFLCQIFDITIPSSELLLTKNEDIISKEEYRTYKALMDIMRDKVCNPLSENKESSIKYIEPIFNALGIILKLGYFDEFQKALQLLNLIENDEILLYLAKLYYKNGFLKSAYDEFIRSIKTFEKIDVEGLEMMKRILKMG
jgi:tetratricopeptide (TPR) repeat protein